jgi:hypothetical protein
MTRKLARGSLLLLLTASCLVIAWLLFGHREPYADFTAAEFRTEYKDWKAANERYVGQSLAIRGPVESVEYHWTTPHGWKSVVLGTGDALVVCDFPPARVEQAEALVPGQVIVVRGVCKGEFAGYPILSDCVVENGSYLPSVIGNLWGHSE